MLVKARGIVLRNTKYSETSVVSRMYTKEYGVLTFMINGVRSKHGAVKPSLLQPLSLLELVLYYQPQREIQRLKEAKSSPPLERVHFDVVRSSVGMFAAELIQRAVQEEEPNPELFDFLEHFILSLDDEDVPVALMPHYLALHLTRHLGFFPQLNFSEERNVFHLVEGEFAPWPDTNGPNLEMPYSEYLWQLGRAPLHTLPDLQVPKAARGLLLQNLVTYYKLHLPGFNELRSLSVLQTVLAG